MDDVWNARRVKLQAEVRAAVLELFAHTSSAALMIDLDPPHDRLLCVAGDRTQIAALIAATDDPAPERPR